MPQMKPMNWMILYIMFNILIYLMNIFLFFLKNNKLMIIKIYIKNNNNWKW